MSKPFAVILPLGPALRRRDGQALPPLHLRAHHGLILAAVILATAFAADAADTADAGAAASRGIFTILASWTPLLLKGFGLNILISFLAMGIGTLLGAGLGLALISPMRGLRLPAWGVKEFFRNAPWLILLFFMIFLLPYHMHIGGVSLTLPDWLKAVIGLALPVMANVAELFRGAVLSINPGQWEAAEALGFTRRQQLFQIIIPQAFARMIPPWMNLYAILTTSTTLASIVGVSDVVTLAGQVLAAEGSRPGLLAPIYGYVLLMFFAYTYPISWFTRRLEAKYQVRA